MSNRIFARLNNVKQNPVSLGVIFVLTLMTAGVHHFLIVCTEFNYLKKERTPFSNTQTKTPKTITQMCLDCPVGSCPDGLRPLDTCNHLVRLQEVLQTIQADLQSE